MKKILLIAICAMLGACGGGGGGSSTGNFMGVQGLSYNSPSKSGVTDANGNFEYVAGETMTFSIGGITLGSITVDGDGNVSDMFTYSLPTTEKAMRQELGSYNDITDLDRIANIIMLLLSLDNDADAVMVLI